jgi:uncharacterized protein (DUF983 family)
MTAEMWAAMVPAALVMFIVGIACLAVVLWDERRG